MNALREECQRLRDELIALRREFHRDPELGLHEHHTAARIERELDRCGIPHERVGETAVVGHLTGNRQWKRPCRAARGYRRLTHSGDERRALPLANAGHDARLRPRRAHDVSSRRSKGFERTPRGLWWRSALPLPARRGDRSGRKAAHRRGHAGWRTARLRAAHGRPTFPRGPSASSRGPTTRASTTLSSASTAKARTSPRRSSAWTRSISQASSSSRSSPSSRA